MNVPSIGTATRPYDFDLQGLGPRIQRHRPNGSKRFYLASLLERLRLSLFLDFATDADS